MEKHELSPEEKRRIERYLKMEEEYQYRLWLKRHTVQPYIDVHDGDNYDLSDDFHW